VGRQRARGKRRRSASPSPASPRWPQDVPPQRSGLGALQEANPLPESSAVRLAGGGPFLQPVLRPLGSDGRRRRPIRRRQ